MDATGNVDPILTVLEGTDIGLDRGPLRIRKGGPMSIYLVGFIVAAWLTTAGSAIAGDAHEPLTSYAPNKQTETIKTGITVCLSPSKCGRCRMGDPFEAGDGYRPSVAAVDWLSPSRSPYAGDPSAGSEIWHPHDAG
jgi:hypothetical protein